MTPITRIDPDFPLCWENSETVRIGFEYAGARIRKPPAGVQRFLGALCTGIPTPQLAAEARRCGVTPQQYAELMSSLQPVLQVEPQRLRGRTAPPAPPPPLRIVIADEGRPAPGLRETLGALEPCIVDANVRAETSDLIVHVERYLEPLERAQRWRALGIPHLLIRFSDRAVHVGPVVETAGAPCHSCVSLGLVARDAALPLLAMQLHEKVPHSETPVAGEFAAVYAALLIREWRDGARSARTTRWVIPIVHGKPHGPTSSEAVPPHPGCSCRGQLEADLAPAVTLS